MKIAYFTSCYPRSSDTFIRSEVKQLRKMGFIVHTISVRKPTNDQIVSDEIREEFQNTQYLLDNYPRLFFSFFLLMLTRPLNFFSALALAYKTCHSGIKTHIWQMAYFIEACLLARILEKNKITHLHNHIGESSATVAMLASALSDVPFSQTIHGPGIFFHPERWALGEKIKQSSFTRCVSEFCKSQCMIFSNKLDWEKLHVIHCAVDQTFFSPSLLPIPKELRLVNIGRFELIKGHFLILEAAEKLMKEGISYKIVLIGDGPLRKEIETEIKRRNLQKHIEILGWISSLEVRKQIERSRAVVSASLNEGIPIVLMESFALGRPVISPIISGVPELVVDGKSGFLFPAGSVEGLTNAMRKVFGEDVKKLEDMGLLGAKKVDAEFRTEVEIPKLASLFLEKHNLR